MSDMTCHSKTPVDTSDYSNHSQILAPPLLPPSPPSGIILQSETPSTQSLTPGSTQSLTSGSTPGSIPSLTSTPPTSTSTQPARGMSEKRHHVEMTHFGAVCFHPKCMTRLGKTFRVCHQTLRTHFHNAKCHTGEIPDCTNLARDLCKDLSTLRKLLQKGVANADVMVGRVLPVNCTIRSTGSYCFNCGLVGKPSSLRRAHYTDKNTQCSLHHLRTGTVLTSSTIRKVKIPQEVVNLIRKGEFDYGNHNDPKSKRISGRVQSIEELSCQASGNDLVSF